MKKILIGGCSFSENINNKEYEWVSWSKLLSLNDNIEIKNTATSSYGQPKISESITNELLKNTYDLVILQWSGISRGYKLKETPSLSDLLGIKTDKEEEIEEFFERMVDLKNIEYIKRSLIQIFLTQQFLEKINIPYISFWGWKQIDDNILNNKEVLELTKKVYNNTWILKNKNNGFADECGVIERRSWKDFHPTSKCHYNFYKNLQPIIENKLNLKLDSNLL